MPNASLKKFYSVATGLLKKGGSRVKAKKSAAWVAPDAAKLVASHKAIPPPPWSNVPESASVSPRNKR
jgi:hypothetical protein